MNKFIWTSEYTLGVKIIDEQHQHFFDIVNRVYDILEKNNNNKEEIVGIINELTEYAYLHLSTEEKYFNQFAYADIANHMKYHTMFRKQVAEYSERIKNANEDLPKIALEVTDFAKNWLMKHILVADKMYVKFFKEHDIN